MKNLKAIGVFTIAILGLYLTVDWISSSPSRYERVESQMFDEVLPYCAELLQENVQQYVDEDSEYSLHDDLWNCVRDKYPEGY